MPSLFPAGCCFSIKFPFARSWHPNVKTILQKKKVYIGHTPNRRDDRQCAELGRLLIKNDKLICLYPKLRRYTDIGSVLVFFFSAMCAVDLELPWDQPSSACQEYLCWKENKYTTATPWSKLDTLTLSLLRKILVPSASQRLTLDKIQDHKWCQMQFNHSSQGKWCGFLLFV